MTDGTPDLDALTRALAGAGAMIRGVRPEWAHAPTPCAAWDVEQLLAHVLQDLRQFRATASGAERSDAPDTEPRPAGPAGYDAAARDLLDAWRDGGVEGRTLHGRMGDLPATWAVGLQTADVIVHGWDVARATGQDPAFDEASTLAALAWARANLKPEFRGDESSGKAFGPEVGVEDGASSLDQLVAFFGRDPGWAPERRAS